MKTYLGKICEKHPELKGERRFRSKNCVECFRVDQAASKKKRRADLVKMRKMLGIPAPTGSVPAPPARMGKVCEKHPELEGARRKNYSCVECHREAINRWRLKHRETQLRIKRESATRARQKNAAVVKRHEQMLERQKKIVKIRR